jgi:DNA-binding NtrC family response regulator
VETGAKIVGARVEITSKGGRRLPISVSTALLRSAEGRVVGAVESFRDLSDLEDLRRQVNERRAFDAVVGSHPRMREVLDLVPVVAASDATILITGPSGSGKNLVAATIHRLSHRRAHPFVVVSCAALPEMLLESELFGHVKGAFTDARRDRAGRVALAEKGTLFLDEVGDLPAAVQVKLLRFLQDREYEPVGSERTVHANVRVLAATNRDLAHAVSLGKFREDLYYRLAVVELALPALAEHREDVPALAAHFIARQAARTGKDIRGVSDDAIQALRRHDWPGNVRELENAIEHAFVLCAGDVIRLEHLPRSLASAPASPGAETPIELAEADAIRAVLRRCGGSRSRAAQELGVHRSTLWRKLQRLRG